MEYIKPTYEEYCKATEFSRMRYRIETYVRVIATILALFLIYYTITNIEEMKANPIDYAEEKMNVNCMPIGYISGLLVDHSQYGSDRNITSIKKG